MDSELYPSALLIKQQILLLFLIYKYKKMGMYNYELALHSLSAV